MPRIHIPSEHAHDPLSYAWGQFTPEIGAAAAAYSLAVYEHSQLSMREMEAARMRTALINGCHLCREMRADRDLAGHIERSGGDVARAASVRDNTPPPEEFYAAVADWRQSALFSDRERLAIEYAERLGEAPKSMDEDEHFWERMHAHYTDREIVDLTFSIGSWMALGRFTHVLALDGVCMPTMNRS
ncbi:MAG: carboxymuconolactone decarboxylase family protein [Erythrobacter sp.]|nr:MAG: carboxymuconolactone decarboxylase family protein [Erythrobacter sp.]